jgi:hypothetical protein
MQTPKPKPDIKTRFRDAVIARKKADTANAKSRGADLLATIRKHAVNDLEALEAVYIVNNGDALLHKIEEIEAVRGGEESD